MINKELSTDISSLSLFLFSIFPNENLVGLKKTSIVKYMFHISA